MINAFYDLLGVSTVPDSIYPIIIVIVGVICCELLTTITGALLHLCGWRK